jgi:hypothetical protein
MTKKETSIHASTLKQFFILSLFLVFVAASASITDDFDELAKGCEAGNKKYCQKLIKIATKSKESFLRREAVKYLSDQVVLAKIAKNDTDIYVRTDALKKISEENQTILINFALHDENPGIRGDAINKVNDQQVLISIALNDKDQYLRDCAVSRLNDQQVLTSIALNDKDKNVRGSAVNRLKDQNIVIQIFWNDKDYDVRFDALKRIHDQNTLKEVVINEKDSELRKQALFKLKGQEIIAQVLLNDPDPDIRLIAAQCIEVATLLRIARDDNDIHVNFWIQKRIGAAISWINDIKELSDLVRNAKRNDIQSIAFNKLPDSEKKILRPWLNLEETKKLKDRKLLEEIIVASGNKKIRQAAEETLARVSGRPLKKEKQMPVVAAQQTQSAQNQPASQTQSQPDRIGSQKTENQSGFRTELPTLIPSAEVVGIIDQLNREEKLLPKWMGQRYIADFKAENVSGFLFADGKRILSESNGTDYGLTMDNDRRMIGFLYSEVDLEIAGFPLKQGNYVVLAALSKLAFSRDADKTSSSISQPFPLLPVPEIKLPTTLDSQLLEEKSSSRPNFAIELKGKDLLLTCGANALKIKIK